MWVELEILIRGFPVQRAKGSRNSRRRKKSKKEALVRLHNAESHRPTKNRAQAEENMKANTKEDKTTTKSYMDMADQAMKNYEHALQTGLKLQEEAVRWWSGVFNQSGTQDWQNRMTNFTTMANDVLPVAQKRMEEVLSLMEKNGRTSADLMKKAVDAAQTPVIAESQAKWVDVWTSSLGALRSNAEAISEINTRAIDSWISFVRKNAESSE